jgi:hypothetical protein
MWLWRGVQQVAYEAEDDLISTTNNVTRETNFELINVP